MKMKVWKELPEGRLGNHYTVNDCLFNYPARYTHNISVILDNLTEYIFY